MRSEPLRVHPETTLPDAAYRALARSIAYEALAIGFRPPTDQGLARLAGAGSCAALADAAAECGGEELVDRVTDLAAAAADDRSGLVARHRLLFGHTARGKAPPYETEYGDKDAFQQRQELADLAGFLCAFGLKADPEEHERVDHVSCECEFLSYLARKEAYALQIGDEAMQEETIEAQRLFLRDHLARFTPAFARALEREDGSALYGALGDLLLAFITGECARLGVNPGTAGLRLRIETNDKLPMACGDGDTCDPWHGGPVSETEMSLQPSTFPSQANRPAAGTNQERTMPAHVDHPIMLLRREHDEALTVLYQLEAALRTLTMPEAAARGELDLGAIERAVAFLDEEVRAHNEREEESLFPALEQYLPPSGPTAVMRFEHREFWTLLSALQAAIRESPPSPSTICERGLAAVDLLRRHIEKENGILFPMAMQLLSAPEMSSIALKMEEIIDARAGEVSAAPKRF